MYNLATGLGKTEVAIAAAVNRRTLFLAPSINVVEQTAERALAYGLKARAFHNRGNQWPQDGRWVGDEIDFAVATHITGQRRLEDGTDFGAVAAEMGIELLVIDEAHRAPDGEKLGQMAESAAAAGVAVLGLSATPYRLSNTQGFEQSWRHLVTGMSVPQGINDGWLSPLTLHSVRFDEEIVGGEKAMGDYTLIDIERQNEKKPIFTEGAIDRWLEIAKKDEALGGGLMKTICFAVRQRHAVKLAEYAQARGVKVGILVSGKDFKEAVNPGIPTDPTEVVHLFRSGGIDLLVNVEMTKEGFDVPAADAVLILRPTKSKGLYRQMSGRATRKAAGKLSAHIIDFTGNWREHGAPDQHDEWSLEPRGINVGGEPPLRMCESLYDLAGGYGERCGQMLHHGSHVCPVCKERQGTDCQHCGGFSFWKTYTEEPYDLVQRLRPEAIAERRCIDCLDAIHYELKAELALEDEKKEAAPPPPHFVVPPQVQSFSTKKEPTADGEHTWSGTRSAYCNCEHNCWQRYPDTCDCNRSSCRNDRGWGCGCIQKRKEDAMVKVRKPGGTESFWRWAKRERVG